MKSTKYYIIGLLLLSTTALLAQDCVDYYRVVCCNIDRQKGYKIYSQSKSAAISVNDTIEFNIVFYGFKDYVSSFCTQKDFYPIHFRLIDPNTRDILYDNTNDKHIKSLEVGFGTTKSLAIQINLLANNINTIELQNDLGCIGLLIQYANYLQRLGSDEYSKYII